MTWKLEYISILYFLLSSWSLKKDENLFKNVYFFTCKITIHLEQLTASYPEAIGKLSGTYLEDNDYWWTLPSVRLATEFQGSWFHAITIKGTIKIQCCVYLKTTWILIVPIIDSNKWVSVFGFLQNLFYLKQLQHIHGNIKDNIIIILKVIESIKVLKFWILLEGYLCFLYIKQNLIKK